MELSGGAIIWGFSFISAVWALQVVGPVWLTAFRFLGAALFILVPAAILAALGMKKARQAFDCKHFKLAFAPGMALAACIMLQTTGLLYTTAGKAGFITTLYVLIVPLCEAFIWKRRLHNLHGLMVAVALFGAALMCRLSPEASLATMKGDLLIFLCSFFAAIQILLLSHLGRRITAPMVFNVYLALWTGLGALPFAFALEGPAGPALGRLLDAPFKPLVGGFFFLVFGATHIAYLAQIRAQRVLSASVASMLCLLESPFSAVAAYFLLHERLDALQMAGGALILAAAAGVVLLETRS